MKKIQISITFALSSIGVFSQSNQSIWTEVSEAKIVISGKREIVPEKYKTYHLDLVSLRNKLSFAPNDKDVLINNSTTIVNLPMPNGQIQQFKVVEAPVMDNALQIGFPNIKTYSIKGIDDVYCSWQSQHRNACRHTRHSRLSHCNGTRHQRHMAILFDVFQLRKNQSTRKNN